MLAGLPCVLLAVVFLLPGLMGGASVLVVLLLTLIGCDEVARSANRRALRDISRPPEPKNVVPIFSADKKVDYGKAGE